jgi:hypothetical protein
LEAERKAERLEAELKAERLEAERLEAERLEAERLEAERKEARRMEVQRKVEQLAERLEAERKERERKEAQKLEAQRLDAERKEAEKLQQIKSHAPKPIEPAQTKQPVASKEAVSLSSDSGCKHYFGYLGQRDKGEEIPAACLECPKSLDCMLQKYKSKESVAEIKKWYPT